jgi:hypothetical protein
VGNCRCDLASHLAQARRTIHVVMAAMSSMAVIVISVFNIIVIAVLILRQTAQRLKVLQYEPRHHTEDRNQHKGDHGGDYLASIRVRTNSCRVQMVTIAISMTVFKSGRQ